MPATPVIEARNLSKSYKLYGNPYGRIWERFPWNKGKKFHKEVHALKDVSFDVMPGECVGLIGTNGAGKSTFINIMAGTVVKTSGSISIWGTDIDANPRQSRANIGIVPQELNIDAFFTPRETLDMMAGLFGVPKSERHTDEILEMVGLTEQADFYSRRLSGGMRRRLLVGKAMVHQPPILVLDEPTAGCVDELLRTRIDVGHIDGAEAVASCSLQPCDTGVAALKPSAADDQTRAAVAAAKPDEWSDAHVPAR